MDLPVGDIPVLQQLRDAALAHELRGLSRASADRHMHPAAGSTMDEAGRCASFQPQNGTGDRQLVATALQATGLKSEHWHRRRLRHDQGVDDFCRPDGRACTLLGSPPRRRTRRGQARPSDAGAQKGRDVAAIHPTVAPIQYIDDDDNIIPVRVDSAMPLPSGVHKDCNSRRPRRSRHVRFLKEGASPIKFLSGSTRRSGKPGLMITLRRLVGRDVGRRRIPTRWAARTMLGQDLRDRLGTVDTEAKAASEEAGQGPASMRSTSAPSAPTPTSAGALRQQVAGAFNQRRAGDLYQKKGEHLFPHRRLRDGATGPGRLAFKDPALATAVAKVMTR